jgi:hypothetical protein
MEDNKELKAIVNAIKELDKFNYLNTSLKSSKNVQTARIKLVDMVLQNGFYIQPTTYILIKRKK